ncbi:transmembrane Fragile-X-F protein [Criibacterium bergeronii]|uniref:Transmembrane Fragile-X-F protein n=1 Tax=Criibacterium bergeronii TaxID=1871336 RepID=A0A1C0AG65_9FIRM|nr:transmembrane Fragile-X-F protein [Criibacterium bergeronii]RDY21408.1 transmembrane Fragile-X-F protein [Criibacterium bergeronii]
MGFAEILTIIFVLLKVFGVISWSWWIVFLPEIIAVAIYILLVVIQINTAHKIKKQHDDFFNNF